MKNEKSDSKHYRHLLWLQILCLDETLDIMLQSNISNYRLNLTIENQIKFYNISLTNSP